MEKAFRSPAWLALFIFLASMAVYINSLKADFVWDDYPFIVENPSIKHLTPVRAFFLSRHTLSTTDSYNPKIYRPLRTLSYAMDNSFWGLNPMGFHLSNIVLHAINSSLAFASFLVIGLGLGASFLGGLFFALHPIHTEAVTFVSGRSDLLATLFILSSFILFVKALSSEGLKRWALYSGCLVAYLFALFSKEAAVTLLLALFLYDLGWSKGWKGEGMKRWLLLYGPLAALSLFYVGLRFSVLGQWGHTSDIKWEYGYFSNVLTMAKIMAYYLRLLLVPTNLSAYYSVIPMVKSLLDFKVLFSLAFLGVCLFLSVKAWRQKGLLPSLLAFASLWYVITLLPASNLIVPLTLPMAERFLYIPSWGFCLLAGVFFQWCSEQRLKTLPISAKTGFSLLFLPVLLFLSLGTIRRNVDWQDEATMWNRLLQRDEDNIGARLNLGVAYTRKGRYPEALSTFDQLSESYPHVYTSYACKAVVFERQGDYASAIQQYRKALDLGPERVHLLFSLGRACLIDGKFVEAEEALRAFLEAEPDSGLGHFFLGLAFEQRGLEALAAEEYERAMALDSNIREASHRLKEVKEALKR